MVFVHVDGDVVNGMAAYQSCNNDKHKDKAMCLYLSKGSTFEQKIRRKERNIVFAVHSRKL
jgi:hypothetical protein